MGLFTKRESKTHFIKDDKNQHFKGSYSTQGRDDVPTAADSINLGNGKSVDADDFTTYANDIAEKYSRLPLHLGKQDKVAKEIRKQVLQEKPLKDYIKGLGALTGEQLVELAGARHAVTVLWRATKDQKWYDAMGTVERDYKFVTEYDRGVTDAPGVLHKLIEEAVGGKLDAMQLEIRTKTGYTEKARKYKGKFDIDGADDPRWNYLWDIKDSVSSALYGAGLAVALDCEIREEGVNYHILTDPYKKVLGSLPVPAPDKITGEEIGNW